MMKQSNQTHREDAGPPEAAARDEHIAPAPRVSVQAFCENFDTAAAIQAAGEDRRLAKAHLQHVITAAAMNLSRLAAWLMEVRRAKTRVSRFARLALAG